ncbi:MAG: methyl-accepting chemotaxis protein [Hydrogenovibrio sp.]|uniref:methyl-accepting chemotaxis protein n=1 Tax=Hydrogenovibrio sp. TaxID=2065821 RepID=UPI0028709088|nr:methyl-accepting chemotaxis protein [Hydrogenovibrio sp.]MDR9498118.1 methyl-accepting chemotaxis protein [Hydrogenovibrio sp.]
MNPNDRPLINEEIRVPDHYRLISRTDLKGTILEANSEFIEISGYEHDEIIGQPHNILRHPDVPKAVFKDFWDTLHEGKGWTQLVKNRAKDGRYYWVIANAAPVVENGQVTGYISVRTPPPESDKTAAAQAYKDIHAGKKIIRHGHIDSPGRERRNRLNPFYRLKIMPKLAAIGTTLVVIGIAITALLSQMNYQKVVETNSEERSDQINERMDAFVANARAGDINLALGFANHPDIQAALESDYGYLAKQTVDQKIQTVERAHGIKPKVHVHDARGHSFYRSWTDKTGDDISTFRYTVNQVREQKQTVGGMELGRAGIAIRSVAPVYHSENGQVVGSVEVITGIDNLRNRFKERDIHYASVLTDDALDIAQKAQGNPKIGPYTLSSTELFNPETVSRIQNLDINRLIDQGYLVTEDRFIVALPITDTNNDLIGYHLLDENLQKLNTLNAHSFDAAIDTVIKVAVSMIILILIFLLILRSNIVKPIKRIAKTMDQARDTGNLSERADARIPNEMGMLAEAYNGQMQMTQVAMGEAGRMMKDISEGRLKTSSVIPMTGDFEVLKRNLNSASEQLSGTFDEIRHVLQEIHAGNFSYQTSGTALGEFKNALHDAQASMSVLKGVFYEVNELMSQVAQGFFGKRITAKAEGEMQVLKDNINESLDALEAIIENATKVMVAQGSGDLKQRINMETDGTLAVLREGINNSVSNVSSLMAQTTYSVNRLANGTMDISTDVIDLSSRTQQQAASLQETAASMEQITSTIQQTANNASDANEAATLSLKEAQDANKVVHRTIESINEINEASTKISEITSLIDSIAFQTNLLALNAAVEAARAGEHGRGFAVVAGEVRSLAGKSSDAAKDIRGLIDNTVEKVQEGAKLADESGKALELINGSIEKIGNYVKEISDTTAEQAKGVEQVNTAISSIDQVTQQNSALVEKTADRTADMSRLAEEVQKVIGTFKIDLRQIGFETAMQTGKFVFAHARRAHRQWKGLVLAYVEGIDAEFNHETATDHTKCALGQWMYGEEGQEYMRMPEMQEVEKWHTEMHATIKRILEAHHQDDIDTVKREFDKLDEASEKVISGLTQAEEAVARKHQNEERQQAKRSEERKALSSKPAEQKQSGRATSTGSNQQRSTPQRSSQSPSQQSGQAHQATTHRAAPARDAGTQTPPPPQPAHTKDEDEWSEF